jgi:two-component system sensor histidine kinase BaeS
MTAEIAHELKSPLSTISGYSQTIRDGNLSATPERLTAILRQAQRLEQIVGDLRTLSLSDVGALMVSMQVVPITELIHSVVENYAVEVEQRDVELASLAEAGVGDVEVDPGRFSQVLTNLVSNALRHTPAGGSIQVTARRDGESTIVSVADTGEGIAEAELPLIFERYYRAGDNGKDVTTGSGLGLPIAKALVEAHGGSIWAESRLGEGTVFTIRLPQPVGAASH